MYKVNNRKLLNRPVQARRPMSTHVRKGGLSKLLMGGLLISAAGMAYYQKLQKNDFHSGDSDPYARTKKTLSNASDKLLNDDHLQEKSSGAIDELGYAAKHIKNSAELAADAARDALSSVEKEGKSVVNNLKEETQNVKSTIVSEADKLRSKAYLKEGDRSPEDVVSHATNVTTNNVESTINNKAGDANQAAFNAANKFKQAKETVTHEIKKDTEKVKQVWDDNVNNAKSSLYNAETEVKSTIDEKAQAAKDTASSAKSSLFNLFGSTENTVKDAAKDVKDTANDVKDTVKNAANDFKTTVKDTDRTPWESRLGSENAIPSKSDHSDSTTKLPLPGKKSNSYDYYHNAEVEGNPMVMEKHSVDKTKPLWETSLEEHAKEVVHDTSTLVDKDTEKVKQGVWDAKEIANEKAGVSTKHSQGGGFWSSLFGTEKKVADQVEDYAEEAKHNWEGFKSKADDVKENASQTWQDAKDKAAYEASRAKNNVNSTIDDLSYKSNKEASRLETGWNNLKNDANYEAEQARYKAEDVATKAKNEASRLASDVTNTAKEVKDEGSRLTRQASNHIAGSLNDVSSKAEELKYKAEDTAKSWYQKGAEQVKSSINTAKNVADKDINWVEEKIHNGVEGAKGEVDRLLGFRDTRKDGYEGHVIRGERYAEDEAGQLRATRDNIGLKPAEVVVEQAHGKDM